MKDVFNEDYKGSWLLVCVEAGSFTAFIDRAPVDGLPVSASPDEMLHALRRLVDTRPNAGVHWQPR